MPPIDLIGSNEAARILSINRATLNRWAAAGRVPIAIDMDGLTGAKLYERADIEALAKIRRAA